MIDVALTKHESRICAWVGKQRYEHARACGCDRGLGTPANAGPEFDIRGALAEYAAAIALNLYWRPSIGLLREKDVGGLVQTRSIANPSFALIVKPDDKDADPFVLVLQRSPLHYRLLGWRFAADIKRNYPLRCDRGDPAHFAPQDRLDDMASLLAWIATRRRVRLGDGRMAA